MNTAALMPVVTIPIEATRLDARGLAPLLAAVDAALEAGADAILVDLERVDFIDSVGLAGLVALKRRVGARRVALAGLRPFVASVVRAAQLTDYFDVFATAVAGRAFLSA